MASLTTSLITRLTTRHTRGAIDEQAAGGGSPPRTAVAPTGARPGYREPTMGEWLLVLLGGVLTIGTAIFVATEFSLVALDRPAVARAVAAGDARARTVLASLRELSTQLSAAQVGITLTTLLLGYLAQPSLGRLLAIPLERLLPAETADSVATGTALVLVTLLSMVFGELVPQFLGISAPLQTAKVVAVPVRIFSGLARPLIALLNGSANAALRALGVTPQEELSGARTPQELASLLRRSAEAGTLGADTAERVSRSLDFSDRTAVDVMTPRVRASSIGRSASAAEVVLLARHTGHSRFPVVGTGWDDVQGLVHVKSAVAVPADRREDVEVAALMAPVVSVPETMRLDSLLVELRASGLQLAVVVDEYGGTSGLVTLEDLVEELVGEVADEPDTAGVPGRRLRDGSWSVSGMWRPDEVRQRIGATVPDGPAYETLGGFLMERLGRVPARGDWVDVAGWRLQVARMEGRRVARVRVLPLADTAAGLRPGHESGEGAG